MRLLYLIVTTVFSAWAVSGSASAQVSYSITDLGISSLPYYFFGNLNGSGQVAYTNSFDGGLTRHAIRAGAGVSINSPLADLGTLGGSNSYGYGINASGQVVGESEMPGNLVTHAFRTTATGKVSDPGTDLGVLPGHTVSNAYGINASGQVTGTSQVGNDYTTARAYRTTATGGITAASDLGTLGGLYSFGNAINASGQVTGSAHLANGQEHAFRTTATGGINSASDLGSFGTTTDDFSLGTSINSSGQVTGFAYGGGGTFQHAFRTTGTGTLNDPGADLGSLNGIFGTSEGYSINTHGVVVGDTESAANNGAFVAMMYDTSMHDLNLMIPTGTGWNLDTAISINDDGLIFGYGRLNGVDHHFLLTPVPEPSILLLAGIAIAFCRRLQL